ncbi:hypothetical protein, partial [Couchioplanes caeruleus]
VKDIADSLSAKTVFAAADLPAMGNIMTFTDGTNNASVTFAAAPADVPATVAALNLDADFTANFVAAEDADGNLEITSRTGKEVTGGTAAVPDDTFGNTNVAAGDVTYSGMHFRNADRAQDAITALDG